MKFNKINFISVTLIAGIFIIGCASNKKTEQANNETKVTMPEKTKKEEPEIIKTIYFDYNKYNIRKDQNKPSKELVTFLKRNPNINLQIQGNADSRGSSEYNMALGLKRANSLKNYLSKHHIKNTIDVISFGKEKPAVAGDNEKSWAKNRRDDVVVIK